MVFANKAMSTRSHMEQQVANWIEESGGLPPGNGPGVCVWGGGGLPATACWESGCLGGG